MPSPYNLTAGKDCPICSTESPLNVLGEAAFTSSYPKGSVLFVEGESARGVFIVCTGRVKLTTSSSEGRTLILRTLGSGEILGASSVITKKPHETSCETLEASQMHVVRIEQFLALVGSNPKAMLFVARQLAEQYYEAQREIRTLGLSQTTGEKLARLVLDWCTAGQQTENGIRLKVMVTHEEIAQMIGTTRETVTRLLSDLRRRHVIEIKGSTFYVNQPAVLEHMVTV